MARRREATRTLLVEDVACEVTWKGVRRLNLRVSPDGQVRASVPWRTTEAQAAAFVRAHLGWVRRELGAREEARRAAREARDAAFRLWGRELPLRVEEAPGARARARLEGDAVVLRAGADATADVRRAALDALLRQELLARVADTAPALEERVGRHATLWRARRMTSRWGSCNTATGRITLNLALATLEPRCLEGVMVHELCHLWVAAHDGRFYALMDRCLPDWRSVRRELRAHEAELRA